MRLRVSEKLHRLKLLLTKCNAEASIRRDWDASAPYWAYQKYGFYKFKILLYHAVDFELTSDFVPYLEGKRERERVNTVTLHCPRMEDSPNGDSSVTRAYSELRFQRRLHGRRRHQDTKLSTSAAMQSIPHGTRRCIMDACCITSLLRSTSRYPKKVAPLWT